MCGMRTIWNVQLLKRGWQSGVDLIYDEGGWCGSRRKCLVGAIWGRFAISFPVRLTEVFALLRCEKAHFRPYLVVG